MKLKKVNNMKQEMYCVACMRHLPTQDFSKWISGDRNKARRCNSCHDCKHVKARMKKAELERDALPDSAKPVLKKFSKTVAAKRACEVRKKIEQYNEQREIDKMFDL
jgi:hypothetical protein